MPEFPLMYDVGRQGPQGSGTPLVGPGVSAPRRKQGRWRCLECGSTRVTGIVSAYCVGRLSNDHDTPWVDGGNFEIHNEGDVDPASIVCENCGAPGARYERAASRDKEQS